MRRSRNGVRPRLRRPAVVAAVLTVAVAALVLGGAQSSGTPGAAAHAAPAAVTSPIPPIPPNLDYGNLVLGRNTVTKAKTSIDIPQFLLRSYLQVTLNAQNYQITDVDSWLLSPPGETQRYGILAPLRTTVLAFGAIPVTATVHLQQVFKGKNLVPLHIHGRSENFTPFFTDPIVVTGQLELTLSDVSVDQVALDVGPNCHTVSPLQLHAIGQPENPPKFPPGPGKYNVFFGGPLDGTISIPAFSGCHNGSEDLDPLLTGMISAPSNPLHMSQGTLASWTPPEGCSFCQPPKPIPPGLH